MYTQYFLFRKQRSGWGGCYRDWSLGTVHIEAKAVIFWQNKKTYLRTCKYKQKINKNKTNKNNTLIKNLKEGSTALDHPMFILTCYSLTLLFCSVSEIGNTCSWALAKLICMYIYFRMSKSKKLCRFWIFF